MKNIYFVLVVIFVVIAACVNQGNPSTALSLKENTADSINSSKKRDSLREAYTKATKESNDTLRNKLLLDISYHSIFAEDSMFFFKVNKEARKLSSIISDSVGVSATYWDMGQYYYIHTKKDNAYYYFDKAQKIYSELGDDLSVGRLLLNMAIIQKNIKDYTGSEVTTTNAIRLLSPLKDYYFLYLAYNNMGIVFNEMEEYDKALDYHHKALENIKKSERYDRLPTTYNNMGVVYNNKREYAEATKYFKKALREPDKLRESNLKDYARILDNQAYAQFHLEDSTGAHHQLVKALQIREGLNHRAGISVSHLHLADYFLFKKDTARAVKHALLAEEVAAKNNNTRDLLLALRFLVDHMQGNQALDYSKRYIEINDSLYKEERKVRNKFARIHFETDEYISETERLNQQVIRVSTIAAVIFVIFVLLYIIRAQRSKNKLIRQEEQANREIYKLVLAQQKGLESEREKERHRISRELHDGILGRMFGLRLSLDSMNEDDDAESKQKRAEYIKELQKIAQEIRLISRELNKASFIGVDFKDVVEELIRKQPDTVSIELIIDNEIEWDGISSNLKINTYRILQEALSNVYRHAQATTVRIELLKKESVFTLRIEDNGKGFKTGKAHQGIGLKNIKARSRAINGKLFINSSAKGTVISVKAKL